MDTEPVLLPPKPAEPPPVPDFTFQISTGRLYDNVGKLVAAGLWSDHGVGYNAPEWQSLRGVGPLPVGTYRIGALHPDGGRLGPDVLPLTQLTGVTYGRSGFYIHGSSALHPATSSSGCIIAPKALRWRIDKECSPNRVIAVRA